ncbi:MAG: sigma-70 family RNA polymerase sigma factor, partial [Lachnospiraceae bacterium]|nr:sigma-70 family RNA polymerase sigma factor [Lachnospiraceae bacterium]
ANKAVKVKASFLQENEREPTDGELAELMDVAPFKLRETLQSSAPHRSFDTPFGEDGDGTLLDTVPDTSLPGADASMERDSLSSDLADVMRILAPREREILRMAFGIGCPEKTLEEIGSELDLTRERVRQIREKAIRKMSRPSVRARLVQYR